MDDVETGERGDEIAHERDQSDDRIGAKLDAEQRESAVQALLELFQLGHAIAFIRHQTTTSHASASVLQTSNTMLPLRKGSWRSFLRQRAAHLGLFRHPSKDPSKPPAARDARISPHPNAL